MTGWLYLKLFLRDTEFQRKPVYYSVYGFLGFLSTDSNATLTTEITENAINFEIYRHVIL